MMLRFLTSRRTWRVGSLLLAVLALAFLAPAAAFAAPLLGGTTSSYSVTRSTDIPKIWRKVQGKLMVGFNFLCEEWEYLEQIDEYDVDWSTREITVPVDLQEAWGASAIPEGGYETYPSSPAPDELTLSFIMLNKRFSASKLTRYIDQKSSNAQIAKQLRYQGKRAIDAIARTFADYHWGVSTAVLAQTSTVATQSSGTYTLKNAFGSTTIAGGTTAQNAYIAGRFKKNDRVALVRAGALVANAIGTVTAVSATTPSIDVTWIGSVTSANNDNLVLANSVENTTIAGTDYNLGLVGYMDAHLSASVHGLSNATQPNWDVAYSDTSGGRFSGIRLHKAADEIANKSGDTLNCLWMSQGVYRDLIALQQGALRFNDPFAMELDGDIKSKGRAFKRSRRVPPGYVFAQDKNTAVKKGTLLPKPGEGPAWSDGKEKIDESGFVFSMDFPVFLVWPKRSATAYFSGLTEQ